MLKKGDIVEFDRKKQFKYIKPLGSGGTGDAHLFEDELTGLFFVFKKYSPKNINYLDEFYERFVDEIKILFNISHPNIVRVYNYYLYPETKVGYLQMEYVEGTTINNYVDDGWGKDWNEIFTQVIDAFKYLEDNNILHRDVRPANILIDSVGNIKIIDFGFGKKLEQTERDGKSVLLNWPVTNLPDEILMDGTYNHQTEVYFLGKLFKSLSTNFDDNFRFTHIIEKMIQENPLNRYVSFSEVSQDISVGVLSEMKFSPGEKEIYQRFSEELHSKINHFTSSFEPESNTKTIIDSLANVIRKNALETFIQGNETFINVFIHGGYSYNTVQDIEVEKIKDFYKMLINLHDTKKKVVIDNIYTKLNTIKFMIYEDDIPF
ncbi:protein kinase family protein [Clostridium estertheticum]|uniref:protein kinase family protein n=1 Tax=Clostridium estertheticum TaxID=238834 RepID=UPI001C0AB0EC|nr:protein kinase family protein [Clostridium estertheticum]MBU3213980.1 protein kinase family protein [Clostridium estertheticum]WAG54989.1 protein kinase family protein [Clostridium estertheticum]